MREARELLSGARCKRRRSIRLDREAKREAILNKGDSSTEESTNNFLFTFNLTVTFVLVIMLLRARAFGCVACN